MWRRWHTFARLIRRISDWPFAFKMGICPALAMLALIGLAGYGIQATGNQAGLVRTVVDQDLHRAERLSASAAHLQQINGRLYRLTTLQAAHDADLRSISEVAGLTQQTEALAEELSIYAAEAASADEREELIELVGEIRLYRDAIAVVGSMLEIDFPSAVELIKPFDGNARKVLASLEAMTRRAARRCR